MVLTLFVAEGFLEGGAVVDIRPERTGDLLSSLAARNIIIISVFRRKMLITVHILF